MKTLKELNEGKLDEASSESVKAEKLLAEFAAAFKNLTVHWVDNDDDDLYTDNVVDDFPFSETMDDLDLKVQKWAKQSIKNLKKS